MDFDMPTLNIISYRDKTNKPELDEPWNAKNGIYVPQGGAKVSRDMPLITSGISKCSALILKNVDTGDTELLHLDENSLNGSIAGELDRDYIEPFLNMPGSKVAILVNGEASYSREALKARFQQQGIAFAPSIHVPSGSRHLSLFFDPKSDELYCNVSEKKQMFVYIIDEFKTQKLSIINHEHTKPLSLIIEEKIELCQKINEVHEQFLALYENNSLEKLLEFYLKNSQFCAWEHDIWALFCELNERYADNEISTDLLIRFIDAMLLCKENYLHINFFGQYKKTMQIALSKRDQEMSEFLTHPDRKILFADVQTKEPRLWADFIVLNDKVLNIIYKNKIQGIQNTRELDEQDEPTAKKVRNRLS